MKKSYKIKAIVLAVAVTIPSAMTGKVTMTVSGPSPGEKEYTVTENTVLRFAGGSVEIKEADRPVGIFTLSDGDKLLFRTDGAGICPGLADDTDPLRLLRNPVNDRLEFSGTPSCPSDLTVFSPDGKRVISRKGWNGEPVDVSTLPAGAYIMTVKEKNIKFIKS